MQASQLGWRRVLLLCIGVLGVLVLLVGLSQHRFRLIRTSPALSDEFGLRGLADQLGDRDIRLQHEGIEVLQRKKDAYSYKTILNDSRSIVRRNALRALANTNDLGLLQQVTLPLDDPSPMVRAAIAGRMGVFQTILEDEAILGLARDPAPEVRNALCIEIAVGGVRRSVAERIIGLLAGDANESVALNARRAADRLR